MRQPMEVLDEIKRNGFAKLRAPISSTVKDAMLGFEKFLRYNTTERKKWTFGVDRVVNPQIGYVPREEAINPMTQRPYDFKDIFHFDPSLPDRANERGLAVAEWMDWFNVLEILYRQGVDFCQKIVSDLDVTYPDLAIREKVANVGVHNHLLRLLHYHMKVGETGVLGRGHKDEWLFTVNFGENIPGLRVGKKDDALPITRDEDTVILYPGKKAELLTQGDLKALYHDVANLQREKNSKDRFSVTFFFDADMPESHIM